MSLFDHPVAAAFCNRLVDGLSRSAIQGCADWAIKYRQMGKPFPGPWTFKHHPWLKEMHDSEAPRNIGQKAAQMGYTELLLNWTFYNIDILRESVLYILPTDSDASDFSSSRFDPALEASPHLRNLFQDVKNVGLKRAGTSSLYVRGSRSRSKLKSVPAGKIAIDERDEMSQSAIQLAYERGAGQEAKQAWEISTPTVDGFGINKEFVESTQEHYFFRCPHCGRLVELIFPDCLIVTAQEVGDPNIIKSHIICEKCKHPLNHQDKQEYLTGEWVKSRDSTIRGFYINQLYSMTRTPVELAELSIKALTDPVAEQEYYNSNGGLTHVVKGARVTDADIEACIGGYVNRTEKPDGLITMGIDIGGMINVWIDQWVLRGNQTIPKAICMLKVKQFEDLDKYVRDFNVAFAVIDANPEGRKSQEFCARFPGKARACFYIRGANGRDIIENEEEMTVKVSRTNWLDLSLGRFRNPTKSILLPQDTDVEVRDNIKASVRVTKRNADNELVGYYVNSGPDHYGHARNYSEIAYHLVLGQGVNKNIQKKAW